LIVLRADWRSDHVNIKIDVEPLWIASTSALAGGGVNASGSSFARQTSNSLFLRTNPVPKSLGIHPWRVLISILHKTIKRVGNLLTSPWRANNDEETINRDKATLGIF